MQLENLFPPIRIALLFLLAISTGCAYNAPTRSKIELVRVTDGDTIKARTGGNIENIRLLNIDCYETRRNKRAHLQARKYNKSLEEVTAAGKRSKEILTELLKDKPLYLIRTGKDRYNRTLGTLFIGNIEVNKYMLEYGGCEIYE